MNSVVPAAESIHGIYLYGIVLVGHGRLPKVKRISLTSIEIFFVEKCCTFMVIRFCCFFMYM